MCVCRTRPTIPDHLSFILQIPVLCCHIWYIRQEPAEMLSGLRTRTILMVNLLLLSLGHTPEHCCIPSSSLIWLNNLQNSMRIKKECIDTAMHCEHTWAPSQRRVFYYWKSRIYYQKILKNLRLTKLNLLYLIVC